ncbi:reverse transcriptase family protein [Vibrio breoganii]
MWKIDNNNHYAVFNGKLLFLKSIYINKGNGKKRKIFISNKTTKIFYRSLLRYLRIKYYLLRKDESIAHGFINRKSPITNAIAHKNLIGQHSDIRDYTNIDNTTISLDIEDFFPSIRPTMLKGIDEDILSVCFVNDELPQGLPTSPILSNIAMIEVDNMIENNLSTLADSRCFKYVYTRYADDITITIQPTLDNQHTKKFLAKIEREIYQIVKGILLYNGFKLNEKKTKINRFNDATNITGINIYKGLARPSRKLKRNLRAAFHQKNLNNIVGMMGWIESINNENQN